MKTTRRAFLTGAGALSAASMAGIGSSLSAFQAHAANTGGYKALVCVFLLGGLDNYDTILPYDQSSYDTFANVRGPLLSQYNGIQGGSTRARDRLLPLNPSNASQFGSRQFAMPEELSGLKGLFDSQDAAIVGNVGPLIRPLNRTQYENDSVEQPKRLFSHNDQQATWMSSAPEGAQFGWGGRFADAALISGANSSSRDFTTITSLGNELYLTGQEAQPYQIALSGAPTVDALDMFGDSRGSSDGEARYQLLREHFEAMQFNSPNLIERDIANSMRTALSTNETFNTALQTLQPFSTTFGDSHLGRQLQAVANTIAIRDALTVNRQVFFVAVGGFDTHSGQVTTIPRMQRQIDESVVAFHQAMQELGLNDDVTLFTASDFGRTLIVNGDGTDHGWGGHHFVVGGAVQGGRIYGDIPPATLGHDLDAGNGRLIPTTSVEQFAEPLGRWFGLDDAEIATALPNLSNFGGAGLSFI
ncbi:MAG: DUF1501 domain-containing protein [Pseudomonadota bacterium]